jgi:hypothetical protein
MFGVYGGACFIRYKFRKSTLDVLMKAVVHDPQPEFGVNGPFLFVESVV